MNVETKINQVQNNQTSKISQNTSNSEIKFSDELKNLNQEKENSEINEVKDSSATKEDALPKKKESSQEKDMNNALKDLSNIVNKLNQSDDKENESLKKTDISTDNKTMINNDYNIQDKEFLPQMNPNMNFSGDGQPFSSFMGESQTPKKDSILGHSKKDLAEEAAILSTMAENVAIANLKTQQAEIINETGIKKVNTYTGIVKENIVKYDSIIMNQADVEVFANLVQNKELNLNNLSPQSVEKSVQVSKTLADMLAKSMETNQPLRIDFDNNISVIIKISRDGKLSADFLPSSQVAEAYLKENLPLLRQKFSDNNLDYESLNHRERKEQSKDNNRRKGRNDE